MKKIIVSSVLLTISFLLVVLIYHSLTVNNASLMSSLSVTQIVVSVIAELLRAILTSWLYHYHSNDKNAIFSAIRFGLVCTLLIASIWILIGAEFLNPENTVRFIINDSIILLLQGLLSGVILYVIHKERKLQIN